MDYFNTDRFQKNEQIADLLSANRQFADAIQRQVGSQSVGRGHTKVRLIDMKVMNPKKFYGRINSPYRAWFQTVVNSASSSL